MKKSEFRALLREEIRKVVNEQLDPEAYEVLGAAASAQKAADDKYQSIYNAITDSPALAGKMDGYMNRDESFDTPEDFKNFNNGTIAILTAAVKELKKVNGLIQLGHMQ